MNDHYKGLGQAEWTMKYICDFETGNGIISDGRIICGMHIQQRWQQTKWKPLLSSVFVALAWEYLKGISLVELKTNMFLSYISTSLRS